MTTYWNLVARSAPIHASKKKKQQRRTCNKLYRHMAGRKQTHCYLMT